MCWGVTHICCMQSGGTVRLEVVIGTPQKGPYHLYLWHAYPGTLFSGTALQQHAA